MFTAGDTEVVTLVLQRLAAMRSYMRDVTLGRERQPELAHAVGMTPEAMEQMYRLLAIAKYDERYVIPQAHYERAYDLEEMGCSLDFEGGPGAGGAGPYASTMGNVVPVTIESYASVKARRGE